MAGLLPDVFWGLTWNDYDALLFRHHYREQQELAAHRLVAAQLYNLGQGFAQNPKPLAPGDYLGLPLIDPAPKAVPQAATAAWWERMEALAARSGKRFAAPLD